jgi:hypothetical protein
LARPLKPLGELADHAVLELADAVDLDLGLAEGDAHVRAFLGVGDHLRRVQQRLRRDAAHVEADAAERRVALHQHDLLAEVGRAEGGRVPAGTGAEDQHFGVVVGIEARERGLEGLADLGGGLGLRGGRGRRRRRSFRLGSGGRGCRGLRRLGRLDGRDHGALGHLVAQLHAHFLHGAGVRRRHFHRRLVGFERDERILLLHRVPRLHQELDDGDVLEVADVRDLDLDDGHGGPRGGRAAGRR